MDKQKATYRLIYNRTNKLNKQGKAPIYIEVYFQRKFRKFVNTSVYLEPINWDKKHNVISKKYINYINAMRLINNLISNIEEYEYKLINNSIPFTPAKLNDFLEDKNDESKDFLKFYKESIDYSTRISQNTRKEHIYTYNMLCDFKKEILFSEINYDLIEEFDSFLRNEKRLAQNTIHKHHQHFKRFLKIATNKRIFTGINPYDNFSSPKVKSDRTNLTFKELSAIENLEITDAYPELIKIRDMFLFSCFCGLRFSDVQQLTNDNIIYNDDESITIKIRMQKVQHDVMLPISLLFNAKPEIILKKYLKNNTNKIFPKFSNQYVNRSLKIIALMAKINKRLTFHISRHTFGTMLAELTQNPYLIMDLMGHLDITTSMIYIHNSQERINRQLKNVNWH